MKGDTLSRRDALKNIVILPALAAAVAAGALRRLLPCSIVHGTISPNGWCIAWAKK